MKKFNDGNFIWQFDTEKQSITTIAINTGEKATINQGDYSRMGKLTPELFKELLAQFEK